MRSFAIPTSGALAILTTTTACLPDPIFGDWEGTSITSDGYQLDLPYDESVERPNGVYTYAFEISLEIDKKDLEGEMVIDRAFSSPLYGENSQRYRYDVDITKMSRGTWTVEIDDLNELELECVAEKDTLECDGEDVDDARYEFEFERD